MSELKTLKDLQENDIMSPKVNYVLIEDLKAEAVKWKKDCSGIRIRESNCEMCKFIVNFFNLTEEDLKEQTK